MRSKSLPYWKRGALIGIIIGIPFIIQIIIEFLSLLSTAIILLKREGLIYALKIALEEVIYSYRVITFFDLILVILICSSIGIIFSKKGLTWSKLNKSLILLWIGGFIHLFIEYITNNDFLNPLVISIFITNWFFYGLSIILIFYLIELTIRHISKTDYYKKSK